MANALTVSLGLIAFVQICLANDGSVNGNTSPLHRERNEASVGTTNEEPVLRGNIGKALEAVKNKVNRILFRGDIGKLTEAVDDKVSRILSRGRFRVDDCNEDTKQQLLKIVNGGDISQGESGHSYPPNAFEQYANFCFEQVGYGLELHEALDWAGLDVTNVGRVLEKNMGKSLGGVSVGRILALKKFNAKDCNKDSKKERLMLVNRNKFSESKEALYKFAFHYFQQYATFCFEQAERIYELNMKDAKKFFITIGLINNSEDKIPSIYIKGLGRRIVELSSKNKQPHGEAEERFKDFCLSRAEHSIKQLELYSDYTSAEHQSRLLEYKTIDFTCAVVMSEEKPV